ncbi:hypothetical protein [Mycobacterium sp.]
MRRLVRPGRPPNGRRPDGLDASSTRGTQDDVDTDGKLIERPGATTEEAA